MTDKTFTNINLNKEHEQSEMHCVNNLESAIGYENDIETDVYVDDTLNEITKINAKPWYYMLGMMGVIIVYIVAIYIEIEDWNYTYYELLLEGYTGNYLYIEANIFGMIGVLIGTICYIKFLLLPMYWKMQQCMIYNKIKKLYKK